MAGPSSRADPRGARPEVETAKPALLAHFDASKVATTAMVCAVEVLDDNPLLDCETEAPLPLLTPINATDNARIEKEIEVWLAQEFPHLQGEGRQGRRRRP